jgi:[ribosomal protein S5]-alanine N-acetyltransferase
MITAFFTAASIAQVRHVIETKRLRLVTLDPGVLRALLAGDCEAAARQLGIRSADGFGDLAPVFRMRLAQLEASPGDEPWLSRAVVLASERRAIGLTGFHGPPGGAWLRDFAPAGVEFGYAIFADDRRNGYATEAGQALMAWAAREHGVTSFVLSIAPGNEASIGVAAKLGFAPVGEWVHPERGRELVYRAGQ